MTRDELAKQIDDCEPIRKHSFAGTDLSGGTFLGGVFEESILLQRTCAAPRWNAQLS